MNKSTWFTRINPLIVSVLAVGLLVVGSFWLSPAAPAFAAPGTPPAKPTPNAAKLAAADSRLQNQFQREQTWLTKQSDNLGKASDAATKAQAWIDAQKAKGVDTSAVEAALATFKGQIATAQSAHDTAAGILSSHAGFDGSGNVTDEDQARQTVSSARQSLNDAHTILAQAGKDLRAAIKDVRGSVGAQNQLAREQKWLGEQQTNLGKANDVVGKVQTYIANQKAKGNDTSALEAALATYQKQLGTAQASHTTAANVLSAHAGFDDSGHVTNADQAHQTVVDAHQALQDAHNVLKQAGEDLHKALTEYREAHKADTSKVPAVVTPAP